VLALLIDEEFRKLGTYSKLYRNMGDPSTLPYLDWLETGIDLGLRKVDGDAPYIDIHGYLFDTPFFSNTHSHRSSDLTNVEFFAGLRQCFPILAWVWH
jgi:hypothetical protein